MERIFGTIPAVVRALDMNEAAAEALALSAWRRSAGEALNKHTAAVEYSNKRLIIAVDDKTWQRNLEELAPQMLFKLNQALGTGTVEFIEFRIDPAALALARPDSTECRVAITDLDQISPKLIEAANRIKNETLRETFLAAAASVERRYSKEA
ncbi:MAG: DciA family protein [Pyrinomonadaceae bacterium]